MTGASIVGLGLSELGRVYDRTPASFAAEAIRRALSDAGLAPSDVDGLLTSSGVSGGVRLGSIQGQLALRDLRLATEMQAYGSTAIQMVQQAARAIAAGDASVVVCVWADAPLRPERRTGSAYGSPAHRGWSGLIHQSGISSPTVEYALAARRHMARYGTTSEQLGAIAVAQRDWAALNPLAQMRERIGLDDYRESRWIAEPLRLLDCCLVTNGAAAVVLTSAQRAAHLAQPKVDVLGWAQRHRGRHRQRDEDFGLRSAATSAGPAALAMARRALADIDIFELYDCYTFTVLLTLEDYGLCAKGEGGPFVESGVLGPNGSLRVNTGGGQLSGYYLWGMTPLVEAVVQVRGQAGARQADRHHTALVSGNGGILDHHATLVLSR